jgi:hypothetical protein
MLLTLFFITLFTFSSAIQSWIPLASGCMPSSYPSFFQIEGIGYLFCQGTNNNVLFGSCNLTSCTDPYSIVMTDLGDGSIGGSPSATQIHPGGIKHFHVMAVENTAVNPGLMWLTSTNGGLTWGPWKKAHLAQLSPIAPKYLLPGESLSSVGNSYDHIVNIAITNDGCLARYYYQSMMGTWGYVKISLANTYTFPADSPILNIGWSDNSKVDWENKHHDVFAISSNGDLYQNMWDPESSWRVSMTVVPPTILNQLTGSTLFGLVDPGDAITAQLRVFVAHTNGTLIQGSKKWAVRNSWMSNWKQLDEIQLNGPELCSRPAAYSNAGVVTLFSVGNNGDLFTTSFPAPLINL